MMIPKSIGGKDLQTNQEGKSNNGSSFSRGPSSTSKQWSSGFRNPRIVRVPRSLGGKDRHSKVSTIRGLRDRRIRLSVPTAIQLYDLQDKLGLAQPSKVIDWLLDVSKNDIDLLPPLPLGDFVQSHIPISIEDDHKIMAPFTNDGISFTGEDSKEIAKSRRVNAVDNFQSQGEGIGEPNSNNAQELHSAQSFFPLALMNHHGSLTGFPDNSTSFYNWEPSNLSLSQFGTHFLPSHTATDQDPHNNNGTAVMFQSSMPFPSLFPIYTNTPHITSGSDQRSQVNQFRLMSSTSQNIRPPFPTTLNANPKLPNGQSLLREDNNADH